jgi:hypothetical protein
LIAEVSSIINLDRRYNFLDGLQKRDEERDMVVVECGV